MTGDTFLYSRIHEAIHAVEQVERSEGGSRELSLVRTKMQEALFWEAERQRDRTRRGLNDERASRTSIS